VISLPSFSRPRRFALALLLLAVPACGLTDYEMLMRDTQEREERFRSEQKYLGKPVQIPTQKDKEDREVPLASVFLRPPKGVESKPKQSGMMWRYGADSRSDFIAVDMAFAEDNKDFSRNVLEYYNRPDIAITPRQITAPAQKSPMNMDACEFNNEQRGYSVNILRDSSKPVAIVYVYKKDRADSARKIIELSLQSVGIDQSYSNAKMRYDQKSPWKLQASPSP
jgi:hypothetical protein